MAVQCLIYGDCVVYPFFSMGDKNFQGFLSFFEIYQTRSRGRGIFSWCLCLVDQM